MLVDNPFTLSPDEVMVEVLLAEARLSADIEGALGKLIGFRLQSMEDLPAPPLLL